MRDAAGQVPDCLHLLRLLQDRFGLLPLRHFLPQPLVGFAQGATLAAQRHVEPDALAEGAMHAETGQREGAGKHQGHDASYHPGPASFCPAALRDEARGQRQAGRQHEGHDAGHMHGVHRGSAGAHPADDKAQKDPVRVAAGRVGGHGTPKHPGRQRAEHAERGPERLAARHRVRWRKKRRRTIQRTPETPTMSATQAASSRPDWPWASTTAVEQRIDDRYQQGQRRLLEDSSYPFDGNIGFALVVPDLLQRRHCHRSQEQTDTHVRSPAFVAGRFGVYKQKRHPVPGRIHIAGAACLRLRMTRVPGRHPNAWIFLVEQTSTRLPRQFILCNGQFVIS